MNRIAAAPASTADRIISGAAWYSAKRSANEFIGFERTNTIVPFADAPSFAKSALLPNPASTTGAWNAPEVDGASPKETTRNGKRTGSRTSAEADTASHFTGTG